MKTDEYCEIIHQSSPVLRFCERFDESSDKWNLKKHSHPYIELIYYMEEKAGLEAGGVFQLFQPLRAGGDSLYP